MRQSKPSRVPGSSFPVFLLLVGLLFGAGCGGSLRSYAYDDHTIRIDESRGRQNARVYVDQCQVPGVYYDQDWQRWGIHGYTHGPSYFELEVLAEDLASWGAAEWCDPRRAPPGLGQHASAESSPPDA